MRSVQGKKELLCLIEYTDKQYLKNRDISYWYVNT